MTRMTLATSDTLAAHHRCTSIPPPSIIFGRSSVMSRLRDVVDPVLGIWDVDHLAGLSAEAEKARQDLSEFVAKLGEGVERMTQKAAAALSHERRTVRQGKLRGHSRFAAGS